MPAERNKITARQLYIIFFLTVLSPTIRLFPQICSEYAGSASWTTPIVSAVALIVLVYLLNTFFKNNKSANLGDIFELTLGKPAAKILLTLYLIWLLILFFLYIRYYAERLLTSIFPNANIRFFVLVMLVVIYIVSRGKIESFSRFCEFSFLMFIVVFIVFYLLLLPNVKLGNLLPLSYYDIWPVLKSTYPVLGIWGYIIFLFFLGDYVIKKEEIVLQGKKSTIFITIMTTLTMIIVVGSLGSRIAERMPLPFFNAIKLVSIVPEFDRFEAVMLSIWVISDFIVITVFMLMVMNITKTLFRVSEMKYFGSPIILLGYAGSMYLATDRIELEAFSAKIGLPMNIITCFLVPILVFITGKLRRKI